jgi:deoxyribodipyrimidine photo-lyase
MIVYWVRKDFRFQDNPAFHQAAKRSVENNTPLLIVYCLQDIILERNFGFNNSYNLSKILASFKSYLPALQILNETPTEVFSKLSSSHKIEVWANSDIEPNGRKRDKEVLDLLQKNGSNITFLKDSSSINLEIRSQQGNIYQVFTPFKNAVWEDFINSKVLPIPNLESVNFQILEKNKFNIIELENSSSFMSTSRLNELDEDSKGKIYPKIHSKLWEILDKPWILNYGGNTLDLDKIVERPNLEYCLVSEEEAKKQAIDFINNNLVNYKTGRDDLSITDYTGTSRLSMALKWGLISSRWLVHQIIQKNDPIHSESVTQYISELIWREFYRYILWHNPDCLDLEFQSKYREKNLEGKQVSKIPWKSGAEAESIFLSWIKGQTGYPLVDAAMNEIAKTGWMHNRTRMVVASILTKNLGIDWRWGQDYFRSILVDLDEASNNGGWQWAASTGSDPKPIRIFNPYLQAEKYDPKNLYQQKWLPADYISKPIVEHSIARQLAMQRYGLI